MAEEPRLAKLGTPSCFLAPSVPVSSLFLAVVAVVSVVRAAEALFIPSSTCIDGCVKGFTAQVCVLNSSSPFLLLVSGSR